MYEATQRIAFEPCIMIFFAFIFLTDTQVRSIVRSGRVAAILFILPSANRFSIFNFALSDLGFNFRGQRSKRHAAMLRHGFHTTEPTGQKECLI